MNARSIGILSVLLLAATSASAQTDEGLPLPAQSVVPAAAVDAAPVTTAALPRLIQVSGIAPALLGEKPTTMLVFPLAAAPNGEVLSTDLTKLDDRKLVLPGDKPAIYALGQSAADFHPEREPLLLIHGIDPNPGDLQAIVDRFSASTRYQLYLVAYDGEDHKTSTNGAELAEQLRTLEAQLGAGRDVTIVAHSLGGIVTRRALDELTVGGGAGIESFGHVRFIAVDSPWHGYAGPGDHGVGKLEMAFAKVFLEKGLLDMRAKSDMWVGDPHESDPAQKVGLLDVALPANVTVTLVFSKDGTEVSDYTKKPLQGLAGAIAALYTKGTAIGGDPEVVNFWKALQSSDAFPALDAEMRRLAAAGTLDAAAAQASLARLFPEYPGDHTTVLQPHPGEPSLLDALVAQLDP
jgi:pimeloyl-ACP methyl ester carboxylesterase